MSRAFGYIAVLIALAVGLYVASQHIGSVSRLTNNSPKATVDITGVQNDLIAIAQAERRYMASNGRYASLPDLIAAGELTVPANRGPYTYGVEVDSSSFVASASAENPPQGAPRALHIDEQMRISRD